MRGFNHKEFFLLCVHDSHDMIAMFPQLVKFLSIFDRANQKSEREEKKSHLW